MGEFWTRAISLVAVIVCLTGYNTVLDKREQAEEKLKEQQEQFTEQWLLLMEEAEHTE